MRKKSLIITLIIMLVLSVFTTSASALSFTASMTPSSTTVPESTEFTVTVKVSNLDVGKNGINTLSGYLKYDEKIFEAVTDSRIEELNSWSKTYNQENGKLVLTKNKFVNVDEEIFQITLKTKNGISGKSGAISFSTITAGNSESDISASDISTTINIGNGAPTTNTPNGNSLPINVNSNTNPPTTIKPNTNKTNTNTNSVVPVDNSVEEEIPYTGAEDVAVRAIFVVLVIAAISYFKYESMKDVK